MGILAYGILAMALMGMIGTGVYKVKEWGADEVRQEWQQATLKAKSEAEAERARQDAVRQQQDQQVTKRLADARKRSQTLMASLEGHIKAARLSPDCRITPELLLDANAALAGGEGQRPRTVLGKPAAAAPDR